MKVELLSITPNIEKIIEQCGRTCYQSQDKITEESSERFIKMIIKNGHESVLEHGYATFKISGISRACSHQLVRHRLAVFSQQSQRYCKLDEDEQFDYVTPESIMTGFNLKDGSKKEEVYREYHSIMDDIQRWYNDAVSVGIKPEDARFILPNACCTEIVMSCNMREWRHIFKERLSNAAQWEIRDMCKEILIQLKQHAPNIFYDFE